MSSAAAGRKLKEAGTCRVFVSSPFGGFEDEREELVLKLFPKLSHLCQARGIQLAAVDMRWGITEEASSDAQTVNICLREVDRSDIFVGLYGQRYGWHGESDAVLQKNITNALRSYPWLSKVKDRSVTEMEFLHGHLNKPGAIPAIFAFRDKKYDDAEKVKAEKAKDERTAIKYTAESDTTEKQLSNLKDRVIKTKAKCVALVESYETPKDGAQFVYEQLKKHIETVHLSRVTAMTKRDAALILHEAYMASRTSVFVGGQAHCKTLDTALQKDGRIVIVGPPGSGKAALVSHWLGSLKKKSSSVKRIAHFVSCSSESSAVEAILVRLTEELNCILGIKVKSKTDQLSEGGEDIKPQSVDVSELFQKFEAALVKAAGRHKIVLVIDGVGKLQQVSRTAKALFWLPNNVPKSVTIVVTCRESDQDELAELSARGYTSIKIASLEKNQRQEMCTELLKQNSKELSSAQLQKIVDTAQTGSPLYLKTVISELCAFGKYRELDEKISTLIACKSVKDLFQVFIRRLESDYIANTKRGNIIEQVMCSIRLSRKGLSEQELMAMHHLPSHEWSPLFFAMQHVLVSNSGLLSFGFTELGEAVDCRYLTDKNTRVKYQRIMAKFFQDQLTVSGDNIRLDDQSVTRPAEELPWLLHDLDDRKAVIACISNLAIFGRLFLTQEFELIHLWRWTKLTGEQVADLYLALVQEKAQTIAKKAEQSEELANIIKITLISYLMALGYFMEMAHFQTGQEKILLVQQQLLSDKKFSKDSAFVSRNLAQVQSKLANLYAETGRMGQATKLHFDVLEKRQQVLKDAKSPEEKTSAKRAIGSSYHGIAMLYSKLEDIEQAISYYKQALEIQQEAQDESEIADTLHNIGVMYMKVGNYKEALELCTKSFKMYEQMYFANMPPAMAVMLGNLAVCHRNLGQVDEAEAMYLKAIQISERSVGRQHPHVALGLMNIATLEINRNDYTKAEGFLKESIEIFQKTETTQTNGDYLRCLEKYVYTLLKLEKKKEAMEHFQQLFPRAVAAPGGMDSVWPYVYVEIVDLALASDLVKLAHQVSLALLESKHSSEKSLTQYLAACKVLKVKPKPEHNLEKAIEKSPGSLTLIRHYMESELIPSRNASKLLDILDKADAVRKVGADLYGTAATWCNKAGAKDMLIPVLEHAVKKFPNEANFVCSLANEYYNKEEWNKALVHCRQLVKLEPNNPSHRLMYGDLTLRENQLAEAKTAFNDMLSKFPTNAQVTNHAKKALDMIDAAEKQKAAKK